jgi:hypothetical protein
MLYRFQRDLFHQAPRMRWHSALVCVVIPVLILALAFLQKGTLVGAIRANWITIVGLPILWLFVFPGIQRWSAGRIIRKSPAFNKLQVTRVDAVGFHTQSAVNATDVSWDKIVRVGESQSFFLFFRRRAGALFVPKSAFADAAGVDQFRQIVGAAVGGRASWQVQ